MSNVKRLSRILVLLLAVVLAAGVFLAAQASAISRPTSNSNSDHVTNHTKFKVRIKVANVAWGGTDSDIYFKVYYVDGKESKHLLDKSRYNDFERGDSDTYTVVIDRPYFAVKSFGIWNKGSDAMCMEWYEIHVENYNGTDLGKTISEYLGKKWIEKSEHGIKIWPYDETRSKRGEIDFSHFTGSALNRPASNPVYIEDLKNPSKNLDVTWDLMIKDGLYGGFYNPFVYEQTPTLSYKIYAAAQNNTWQQVSGLSKVITDLQENITWDGNNGKTLTGFTYKPQDLLKAMRDSNFYALRVDTTLSFPEESTFGTKSQTVSYYIYRKEIEMDTPTITNNNPAPFRAMQDNYFFNSNAGYDNIYITIPVKGGVSHANYDSAQIAAKIADYLNNNRSNAVLYYGRTASDYLTPSSVKASGSNVNLTYSLKGVTYNPPAGSSGLQLWLKNVKVNWNNATYSLYSKTSVGDKDTARTVEMGGTTQTLGKGVDLFHFFSTHKVDTVAPIINLQEKGADNKTAAWTSADRKWQSSVTLVTSTDPANEKLFPLNDFTNEGKFTVELLSGGKPISFHRVTSGRRMAATTALLVPVISGRENVITLPEGVEKDNLTIRLSARDFAGNTFTKEFTGLRLDTRAPTVSVKTTKTAQNDDGVELHFDFKVTELSGTGTVHYCFVRKGETLPEEGKADPDEKSVIEDYYEEWAFVPQDSSTVVLSLPFGKSFEGDLYYYAKDEAGNRTNTIKLPVSADNKPAECEVTVAPAAWPLPEAEYDIVFSTAENCKVYYRYATPQANGELQRRPYAACVPYDPSKPGDTRVKPGSYEAAFGTPLEGQHILEYKVENVKSGNVAYFEGALGISLTFDSTAPTAEIKQLGSGLSMAAHSFSLSASDAAGFAKGDVGYEIRTADDATSVKTGTLTYDEGAGAVYGVVNTAELGLDSGSYILVFTAKDRNGQTRTETSEVFSIRNAAPTATMTLSGGTLKEGVYIIPYDPAYQLSFTVSETFAGAADGVHSVYWRASADGIEYGEWKQLAGLKIKNGKLSVDATLDTPLAINEGLNSVYVQLVCAENEKNMRRDVNPDTVWTAEPVQLLLDVTKPTARWTITSVRNNEKITGTLTVSDDMTAVPAVTASSGVELTAAKDEDGNELENVYEVKYAGDADAFTLTVTDFAGNETKVEVSTVNQIDRTPPTITVGSPVYTSDLGARQDATVIVTVTEPGTGGSIGGVRFDLGEEDEPMAKFAEIYMTDSSLNSHTYQVLLRGYTGDQTFTVTAFDDLGNKTSKTSGAIRVATGEINTDPTILSQPAYAQDSAPVILQFNVPVIVLPTTETLSEADAVIKAKDLAEKAATGGYTLTPSCVLTTVGSGEGPRACTVWAVDEFDNAVCCTVTPSTIFGKKYDLYMELRQDGQKVENPAYLIAGTHVADPSEPTDTDRTYTASVMVEPLKYYLEDPTTHTIVARYYVDYDNGYDPYFLCYDGTGKGAVIDAANGQRYELAFGEYREWEEEGVPYHYYEYQGDELRDPMDPYIIGSDTALSIQPACIYPFALLSEGDARIGDEFTNEDVWTSEHYNPEDYDDKESLLWYRKPEWDLGGGDLGSEPQYPRIIFDVQNPLVDPSDPSAGRLRENVPSASLNIGLVGVPKDIQYSFGDDYEATPVYIRSKYASTIVEGADETEEATFSESPYTYIRDVWLKDGEVWMNQTLTINCPIITAAPSIEYNTIQNTLEPEVMLQASAGGHGAEVKQFKLLRAAKGSDDWSIVQAWYAADHTNDASIPVLRCVITKDDAETYDYCLYAENAYGLSEKKDVVLEIMSTPIEHGADKDFTVSYSAGGAALATTVKENEVRHIDENGTETTETAGYIAEVGANDMIFRNSVTAKLTLTGTSGRNDRGVKARNSDDLTVELTPEAPSFTFHLYDRFGYTTDVTVHYEKFDVMPPKQLDYVLGETGKTNQPYGLTVTAWDDPYADPDTAAVTERGSGIAAVTLTDPDKNVTTLTAGANGTWTGMIEKSGSYLLRATDGLGNLTQRSFVVSNINTTKPTMEETRNILQKDAGGKTNWTQENIVVTLSFSKPNVTITGAEGTQGKKSFVLDKAARTLTFTDNDTVTVSFRDEYGNENKDTVTVDNIYTEPPQLVPVVKSAPDKLSAQVSFEMAKDANGFPLDEFRKLTDLTVINNGVSYAAASITKKADGSTEETPAVFFLRDNGTYTFTVLDQAGLMQFITLRLSGIDREAPVVTAVSWTYKDEAGNEIKASKTRSDIDGVGYRILEQDEGHRTNGNVTVTVSTDKPTKVTGGHTDGSEDETNTAGKWTVETAKMDGTTYTYSLEEIEEIGNKGASVWTRDHSLVYHENGLYIFNLEKRNGRSDHFGVDVEIIDKTPPEIMLNGQTYLMYIEGRDSGSIEAALNDFTARDVFRGVETDLTAQVTVDYGGLNVKQLEKNPFDKSIPYTVTYTVKDAAGNETEATRTVVLVGMNDVLVTVNGKLPNASMMAEVPFADNGKATVDLSMLNFSGVAYTSYAPGMYTFGQMKTILSSTGKLIPQDKDGFHVEIEKEGWYTFFVQTETRDYFNIYVYVG